jgi:hypothetical protein
MILSWNMYERVRQFRPDVFVETSSEASHWINGRFEVVQSRSAQKVAREHVLSFQSLSGAACSQQGDSGGIEHPLRLSVPEAPFCSRFLLFLGLLISVRLFVPLRMMIATLLSLS